MTGFTVENPGTRISRYVAELVNVVRGDSTRITTMTNAFRALSKDETAIALEIAERKGVLPKGTHAAYLANRKAHARRVSL